MHAIKEADFLRASQVLGEAFYDDPIWKGFAPDDDKRKLFLPTMFQFLLRCGKRYGSSYAPSDSLEGVIIWFPAKTANIGFFRILFSGFFGQAMDFLRKHKREMKAMQKEMKILNTDRKKHMKGQNHLYVMAIGVAPVHQGKGYGGRLLKHLFNESRQLGIPVYLETETEQNVEFYRHYGFKVMGERDFPARKFHIWEMVRPSDEAS